MIYNLSKYISNNTDYVPATGGIDSGQSSSLILLQTGGEEGKRIGTKSRTFQFISRAKSRPEAYTIINTIYELLSNRFNIVFPEVVVDEETYAEITASSILALQIPGYIGANANGLHEWSVNFNIIS